MRTLRYVLAGILMLGLAIPGVALADNDGDSYRKGCSILGTWFGIESLDDRSFNGWVVTVTGKSENRGTNNLEYPTFDPTLGDAVPNAVRLSSFRGTWERTGGRTFAYNFTGFAVDVANEPVYIMKVHGDVTIQPGCQFEHITATSELYWPWVNPFEGDWFQQDVLEPEWGYRAFID